MLQRKRASCEINHFLSVEDHEKLLPPLVTILGHLVFQRLVHLSGAFSFNSFVVQAVQEVHFLVHSALELLEVEWDVLRVGEVLVLQLAHYLLSVLFSSLIKVGLVQLLSKRGIVLVEVPGRVGDDRLLHFLLLPLGELKFALIRNRSCLGCRSVVLVVSALHTKI